MSILFYCVYFLQTFQGFQAQTGNNFICLSVQILLFFSQTHKILTCQHVILRLTELLQNALDNNKYVGTIAMDLSKAFNCMPHDLFVAKLHSYGVSPKACLSLSDYLRTHMQRVKIMDTCSEWTVINRLIHQRSVLGSLLFNIFLSVLSFLPLNSYLVIC